MKLLLVLILTLLLSANAYAWKPATHVYLADIAWKDASDDGYITINKIDYQSGEIIGEIGRYKVNPDVLSAISNNRGQYKAGVLGPDAYPDILTGQQSTHPNTGPWLEHIWDLSLNRPDSVKAFTYGYLTHAAGDIYSHTFVNYFAGGSFTFTPPTNAIRHIVIESYFDKKINPANLQGDFFSSNINGVEGFIYDALVDARRGTHLGDTLLAEGSAGSDSSIPRIFSTIRNNLDTDISTYNKKKKKLSNAVKDCRLTDFSCSKAIRKTRHLAFIVKNGTITTYKEHWLRDVDKGLKAWPSVSDNIAKSLFFNSSGADIDRAQNYAEDYALNHLLSMAGAPDVLGSAMIITGDVISAITPDFLLEPIRKLQEDLLNSLLESAIGMNADELKSYSSNPETYFDEVLSTGAGVNTTLSEFNSRFLKLGAADDQFINPMVIPAAYNTILLNKLIYLEKDEVNRLLTDLESSERLVTDNVMLFSLKSIDASNQWCEGLVFAQDNDAYQKIFMKQPGEKVRCQ